MRLFVALDLDDAAMASIAAEQSRIRRLVEGASIRWVKPEQMHLTLVFLGEVDAPRAAEIQVAVSAPVRLSPFELVFAGIGVFPPHGAPRALWIGARAGMDELRVFQQELAGRIASLGCALESRPFSPHLTIGRWKSSKPSDRRRVLTHGTEQPIARTRVDHATLYQSHLSSGGPNYTELARANLTTGSRD